MSDPELVFRSAAPADFDAIRRLHATAFAALAASHHTPQQIAAHTHLTEMPDYADDLARSHLMLALLPDGRIVGSAGWIAVAETPGMARIRKVFVDPGAAGRGLGSRLVRDAEQRALVARHPRLMVRANINAVPLYRKLGYVAEREGVMSTPDGVDLPVVFMAKPSPSGAALPH